MRKKTSFIAKVLLVLMVINLIMPNLVDAKSYKKGTAKISDDIIITVNGERVPFKAALINDRTYLPVRVIGYALNAEVEWTHKTRKIELDLVDERLPLKTFEDLVSSKGNKEAIFVDDMYLYLNGKLDKDISKDIMIIEERSYLPLRAISEKIGIRSTWIEETKTIEIVNPRTAEIDKEDEEYYIKDLPVVDKQEDYLVGNWIGNSSSSIYGTIYNSSDKLFISREDNGNYNIIRKTEIVDKENTEYNGTRIIAEFSDVKYDKENNILEIGPHNGEYLLNEFPMSTSLVRRPYKLDGERLFGDFTNIGHTKSEYKRY